jgi:phage tail protein X
MYHVNTTDAAGLSAQLGRLDGVVEAVVDADEGVAYLKVRLGEWDETGVRNLIEKEE